MTSSTGLGCLLRAASTPQFGAGLRIEFEKPNAEGADLSDQGYTNIEVYINGLLE